VFHIDLLTPYQETDLHGSNYLRPAPDLINNKEEYEIERILDSQQFGRGCKKQYLIKWKGYPDSDNEWVDWKDVHVPEVIREFEVVEDLLVSSIFFRDHFFVGLLRFVHCQPGMDHVFWVQAWQLVDSYIGGVLLAT